MLKLVNEFNIVGGNTVRKAPYYEIFQDKLLESRINLIDEEIKEVLEATTPEDKLKELCDVLVVTYGLLGFAGVESQDGIKPREPSSLINSFRDLKSSVVLSLFKNLVDSCENIIYIAKKEIEELNVDVDSAFKEVCDSNMSKFVLLKDEDIAIQSCIKIAHEGRYKSPNYRTSPGRHYWVIYDRDTNKILKSCMYRKANMKQFFK